MHDEDKEYPERDEDDADDGDSKRTGTTHRATASISLSATVLGLSRTGSLLYINLKLDYKIRFKMNKTKGLISH